MCTRHKYGWGKKMNSNIVRDIWRALLKWKASRQCSTPKAGMKCSGTTFKYFIATPLKMCVANDSENGLFPVILFTITDRLAIYFEAIYVYFMYICIIGMAKRMLCLVTVVFVINDRHCSSSLSCASPRTTEAAVALATSRVGDALLYRLPSAFYAEKWLYGWIWWMPKFHGTVQRHGYYYLPIRGPVKRAKGNREVTESLAIGLKLIMPSNI